MERQVDSQRIAMTVESRTLRYETRGEMDILDMTRDVSEALQSVKMRDGIVSIFVPGSTAGVTTIE